MANVNIPTPNGHEYVTLLIPLDSRHALTRTHQPCHRRLSTLKKVLVTSLALFALLVFAQSLYRSTSTGNDQSMTSEVSKSDLDLDRDLTHESDLAFQRIERDAKSPKRTKKGKRPGKGRKHKNKKTKGGIPQKRSLRSSGGRVRALREDVRNLRSNITQLQHRLANVVTGQRFGVHLHYTAANQDRRTLLYGVDNEEDQFFVWSLDESAVAQDFFGYNRSPNHDYNKDVYGVVIRFPGQYQVYSQILINGRQHDEYSLPYDCAHETVLARNNVVHHRLLKTFITQHNIGMPYVEITGHRMRPTDSSSQMGVFNLQIGDEIRIRATPGCGHVTYKGDRYASYFGLIRI